VILKAIDLGLMSEHLTTHKGVLKKLQFYYCSVKNPTLKQIIYEQFLIMRNHVQVMLMLMDPKINEQVTVSALFQKQPVEIPCQPVWNQMGEKEITIEARNTAMSMATDNFSSALRMKAHNVRDIHFNMALQQVKIQGQYSGFMKSMGWEHAPESSLEEQVKTLQLFKHLYDIQST
jgi:hypothetical protein